MLAYTGGVCLGTSIGIAYAQHELRPFLMPSHLEIEVDATVNRLQEILSEIKDTGAKGIVLNDHIHNMSVKIIPLDAK